MHWVRKQWPSRNIMTPGEKNINNPMVDQKTFYYHQSPLHIKLALMKQFVKALGRFGDCFGCVCSTFSGLSHGKNNNRGLCLMGLRSKRC